MFQQRTENYQNSPEDSEHHVNNLFPCRRHLSKSHDSCLFFLFQSSASTKQHHQSMLAPMTAKILYSCTPTLNATTCISDTTLLVMVPLPLRPLMLTISCPIHSSSTRLERGGYVNARLGFLVGDRPVDGGWYNGVIGISLDSSN